jgi:uncharacterized protein
VRVWIDLSNSPHALLFAPVAVRLGELGHDVVFTARNNAQTVELANSRGLDPQVIGAESPGGRSAKAAAIAERAWALRSFARQSRPDVALSHNSYAQIAAARSLGIRAVTAMDFEYQPSNHLAFRLADTILMPDAVDPALVRRQGATTAKLRSYPGYKEELYLGEFEPDPEILEHLGVHRRAEDAVVVTRTPPTRALYHRAESELYISALRAISSQPEVVCIALTRHSEQREQLAALGLTNLILPEHAVDALSLMYAADLVVGGGGTMTREAALLGVPTVSVFQGRRPAVDRALERAGALRFAASVDALGQVAARRHEPRSVSALRVRGQLLLEDFVGTTLTSSR